MILDHKVKLALKVKQELLVVMVKMAQLVCLERMGKRVRLDYRVALVQLV